MKRGEKLEEIKSKKYYKDAVIRKMKELGIYKKEYSNLIDIYAGMLHQYRFFEAKFEENGYEITEEYTNKAGAINQRKVPLLTAMESLRKDIATYSDKLCLNPKTFKLSDNGDDGNKVPSVLDQFLTKYK